MSRRGAQDGDSAGALAVTEASVLLASPAVGPAVGRAPGPIEDFVKAMSELPR